MPPDLRSIRTFRELTRYLEEQLDWPLDEYGFDDLTFTYDPPELGLKPEDAVKVRTIHQLRPFRTGQPWGIFFVEFEKKRLPIVVLRRILRHLVLKKRASANAADAKRWQSRDLLFISAWGDETKRELTFAHFVDHAETGLAELRVLGWDDDDTPLHMNYVAQTLGDKLRWDDDLATDPEAWRQQWASAFVLRHRHVIRTSEELAAALAELAKRLRTRIRTILRMEDGFGEIRKLQRAFQTGLIHDLDDDAFADMFAQTVTYGLFSLACRRTIPGNGTAFVKDDLTHYFTSPFLKEMLGIFLGIKSRKGKIDFDELGVSDVTDLLTSPDTHMEVVLADFNNKTRGEDPVIHFYEHFLTAYNKELKVQRGVFYTPQPAVSYIVRGVHELLQTEFDLEDGLASTVTWGEMIERSNRAASTSEKGSARASRAVSGAPAGNIENTTGAATIQNDAARAGKESSAGAPKTTREGAYAPLKLPPLTDEPGEKRTISPHEPFVQILDVATGTATFIVEVIDVIHKTMVAKWKKAGQTAAQIQEAWNEYVPKHLLPRVYGFELMMAPYAIAHMKVGLKLTETGYLFATEVPVRIYLTNTLEPKVTQLPQIGFDALAHEAKAVNEIKWYKRFTVVIGNPPYSLWSQNLAENLRTIIDPYRFVNGEPVKERGALQFEKILQDDYVKFFRLSQVQIDQAGCGILGLITNHAFTDNPTLRGMRDSLLRSFPTIFCLNLHGNSSKKEKCPDGSADENVFDIQQGVAIFHGLNAPGENTKTRSCADLWGNRESKYATLAKSSIASLGYRGFSPTVPFLLFKTQDGGFAAEYERAWKIADMFQQGSMGVVTARDHISIAFEDEPLLGTATEFRDSSLSDKAVCEKLDIPEKKGWDVAKARALIRRERNLKSFVTDIGYRPFDTRRIFYHRSLVWGMSRPTMQHVLGKENIGISTTRSIEAGNFQHVFASARLIGHHFVSLKEVNYFFPLWVFPEEDSLAFRRDRTPNLKPEFLKATAQALGLRQSGADSLPAGLTPEDIFHYAYAVFHSPGYRSRYAEFLKMDFPRLPLTGSLELFRALAHLGGELVALHLLESPKLDKPRTEFIGGRNPEVEKASWSRDTVWLDKALTTGFRGVPEAVWNFHIGGYQVCDKWLKDRKGRTLTKDDLAHYQKIVVALAETIRLMAEIDGVIAEHGGWPGAFAAKP